MTNHRVDTCFQLIGYPPGWNTRNNPRKSAANDVDSGGEYEREAQPLIDPNLLQQFQQFMAFTRQNRLRIHLHIIVLM